ncbi:alpha/beta fold hydrolase [Blastopirellula marina]|uniref:alpha/beta fold hydrolase n=1 Tax=Blastopirellula marina TaxID=124 RepID=UPI000326117D|nr:alpha/beta fold hydrolase [Blastopirellula marina]
MPKQTNTTPYVRTLIALGLVAVLLLSTGCAGSSWKSVRKTPRNPLAAQLQLLSRQGPQATERTKQLLRQYDLEKLAEGDHREALEALAKELELEPTAEKTYAYAELSYIAGNRAEALGKKATALELFAASAAHSYYYLFDPKFSRQDHVYDPQFRGACDLYNGSLEAALRIVRAQGKLTPGSVYRINTPRHEFQVALQLSGRWDPEDFDHFEFASDYEVNGLRNQHRQYGLGVPLIAICKGAKTGKPEDKYLPPGLAYPLTAFLEVTPQKQEQGAAVHFCKIELYDPLMQSEVKIGRKTTPLEADISTPLAYYLDQPQFRETDLATWGLLLPGHTEAVQGLYMLEPYDPQKIPVVMVHGLWSSPITWMEMFNDLRAQPEIRDNYQFWFYLYPTGEPFWISATQFRRDLQKAREDLDPKHQALALDQSVLIGHSMGGLVSRMQTIDSQQDFWTLVTDQSPQALQGTDQDKQQLMSMLFFEPSPSVRQVITLGTPHRGSDFANSATKWLGRHLIALPESLTIAEERLKAANPNYFRDEMLAVATSVDSLAPDSPVLPKILDAPKAPWVKYHTVIGVIDQNTWLGTFAGRSDGVVEYASAHLDEAASELVVTSDHNNVHRHPRSILRVRSILRDHVEELRQEYVAAMQQGAPLHPAFPNSTVMQAGHSTPIQNGVPPAGTYAPPMPESSLLTPSNEKPW